MESLELKKPKTVSGVNLDFSMFSRDDLINLILQRSGVLYDLPHPGLPIKAWIRGDRAPLEEQVDRIGAEIAQRAFAIISSEFEAMCPALDRLAPRRIADIGCGYGLADLLFHRATGAEMVLIDTEENAHRHFGFQDEGAAYADLAKARAFLEANGVDGASIRTVNPSQESLSSLRKVNLAVSLLSCGFHFPVSTYGKFFDQNVTKTGAVILTLRKRFDELAALARLGRITVLDDSRPNSSLVVMEKRWGRPAFD